MFYESFLTNIEAKKKNWTM